MKIVNPKAVKGEDAACSYLVRKGYEIVERNFRKGYGEIDIIAFKDNTLVFVEVKTRSSNAFGSPFESISPFKINTLLKTAAYYKHLNPHLPQDMRFDAIGVKLLPNEEIDEVEHLENITG